MKKIKYMNPTNIDGISNESIKAYFSILYCEIIHPVTKEKVQRTGLLSDTHAIIGAANFLPFGSVGEELKRRWEEIDKETSTIIQRAEYTSLQDRTIIMDNIISALTLYEKIQDNMINVTYLKDPDRLNQVKARVSKVMGAWKVYSECQKMKSYYSFEKEQSPKTDRNKAVSEETPSYRKLPFTDAGAKSIYNEIRCLDGWKDNCKNPCECIKEIDPSAFIALIKGEMPPYKMTWIAMYNKKTQHYAPLYEFLFLLGIAKTEIPSILKRYFGIIKNQRDVESVISRANNGAETKMYHKLDEIISRYKMKSK